MMKSNLLIVFLFVFALTQFTLADDKVPQPAPQPTPAPTQVDINPETLRTMVLSQNFSVMRSLNKVYQAKVKVNSARAALLPKLNITGLFSGGGFSLSAVQFLLPFLNPGNWIELKSSKELLKAEGQSFYISQLNTYASAHSLYTTILSDLSLREALHQKAENMKTLARIVQDQYKLGLVGEVDFRQAEAQVQMAQIQVSQMDELLVQEHATLREMLALPLTTEMTVQVIHPAASPHELETPTTLLPQVTAKSPEMKQLDYLIAASRISKWKVFFSFISGFTYSSSGPSAGFGSLTPGGSFNFDFGTFPAYEMSQLNIQLYELQKKELTAQHAQILESTLGGLQEALQQLELANQAVANQQIVYQAQLDKYYLGTSDLLPVIIASNDHLSAVSLRVKAQSNLDNLRVNLNRIVLEEQFAKIQECKVAEKIEKRKKLVPIEEACK